MALKDIALHQEMLVVTAKISSTISRWSNFEKRFLEIKDPNLSEAIEEFEIRLIDLYSSIIAAQVQVVRYCESSLLSEGEISAHLGTLLMLV